MVTPEFPLDEEILHWTIFCHHHVNIIHEYERCPFRTYMEKGVNKHSVPYCNTMNTHLKPPIHIKSWKLLSNRVWLQPDNDCLHSTWATANTTENLRFKTSHPPYSPNLLWLTSVYLGPKRSTAQMALHNWWRGETNGAFVTPKQH